MIVKALDLKEKILNENIIKTNFNIESISWFSNKFKVSKINDYFFPIYYYDINDYINAEGLNDECYIMVNNDYGIEVMDIKYEKDKRIINLNILKKILDANPKYYLLNELDENVDKINFLIQKELGLQMRFIPFYIYYGYTISFDNFSNAHLSLRDYLKINQIDDHAYVILNNKQYNKLKDILS